MENYPVQFVVTIWLTYCLIPFSEGFEPKESHFYLTPPVHLTYVESQTLRLKCTPRNMNNEITWSRVLPDGETEPIPRSSARVSFEMFGYVLVVNDVTWDDSGKYQCAVIKGPKQLDFFVVNVQVHTLPYWRQEPLDLLLYPGDSGEVLCDAAGTPPPIISWEIDGTPLTFADDGVEISLNGTQEEIMSNFYLDGDSLIITDAQYEDSAQIRCIATNDYGKLIADIYLDVLGMAPRFLHTPHSVSQVVTGNDITVKCTAIGSPRPSITWTLNSEPIPLNTTSLEPHFKLNNDGSLTIYRVMQSYDEGMYMCKVKNDLGEASASGELQVKARTRVICLVTETTAKKGKHVILRCSVYADPALEVTVTWEKNGKPLNPGCSDEDRIFQPPELGVNDSVLVIRSITRDDSGEYGCVAKTMLDKAAGQTTLIVQDVPDRPGPVEVTYLSDRTAIVSWEAGNENDSPTELFIIYMNSTWDRRIWKILKMLPPGTRSTKVDLEPFTSYNFRVKQLNGVGYSELSKQSLTYRTAPSRPYSNPENVRAESTNNSYIDVFWKPMPRRQYNGPGFHYVLNWRQTELEETWHTKLVKDPAANKATISTDGEYGEYKIRVRAANEIGMAPTPWSIDVYSMSERNYTDDSSDGHSDTWVDVSAPSGAPEHFQTVVISPTKIKIKWKPIDSNETGGVLQGYKVRYERSGSSHVEEITTESTITTTTLTGLMPASEYVLYILGFNDAGEGPPTNDIIVETPEDVPGPVTDFTVQPENDFIHVHWNPPEHTNGVLLGYQIIITQYDGAISHTRSVFLSDPTETSYIFSDVLPKTTTRMEVQGSTAAGFGTVTYWEGSTPELYLSSY